MRTTTRSALGLLVLAACGPAAPEPPPRPPSPADAVGTMMQVFERGGAFYWLEHGECHAYQVTATGDHQSELHSDTGCLRTATATVGLDDAASGSELPGVTLSAEPGRLFFAPGLRAGGIRAGQELWFFDAPTCEAARAHQADPVSGC